MFNRRQLYITKGLHHHGLQHVTPHRLHRRTSFMCPLTDYSARRFNDTVRTASYLRHDYIIIEFIIVMSPTRCTRYCQSPIWACRVTSISGKTGVTLLACLIGIYMHDGPDNTLWHLHGVSSMTANLSAHHSKISLFQLCAATPTTEKTLHRRPLYLHNDYYTIIIGYVDIHNNGYIYSYSSSTIESKYTRRH